MTITSLPFLFSAFTYFALGIWIIVRHKNESQRLYGAVCITTCCWQGVWTALFSNLDQNSLYLGLKIGYTGIVFIPAVFYHFISEFTQQENNQKYLGWAYGFSFVFGLLLWVSDVFVKGFYHYSWGLAARAGIVHPLFVIFVCVVLLRMTVLLWRARRASYGQDLKRSQINCVLAALIIYSGGSLDLISNYGIGLFPFSSVFTGIAFCLFTYAIFRYELLSITVPTEALEEKSRRVLASQEMHRLNMSTAFPLVSQGELLGYLLLGEKMSEEAYSKEDLLLLRIIANQAALAYQRVRYLEMALRGARTEMLGAIAGGFAHEIKTPLANISLPAELCFMDLNDIEQGKRKIEEVLPELKQRMKDIMQQTVRASDKIEAIRQFSKPGQVKLEPVELASILQSGIALLDHLIYKLGIKMKTDFPSVIPTIRGNAKQLEIVFVNLIKNAAEAMASSGTPALARNLLLSSREEGNYIAISIKDSGPGIKRVDVGHLFEAYFTTKGSVGTGMGLFLSHQVVKAHGGSIEVQSEEGKGTEFIVRLPKLSAEIRNGVHEAA